MKERRLEGRVALVTAGSGSAIVRRFIDEGAQVMLTELGPGKGKAFAGQRWEGAIFCRGNHCGQRDNVESVSQAVERFGRLDILFNNAADVVCGPIATIPADRLRQSVDASFTSAYLMTQAVLPALRREAHADRMILFTGSIQSLIVRPDYPVYGMPKHRIVRLAASPVLEVAPEGIRVNCVCTWPVDSPLPPLPKRRSPNVVRASRLAALSWRKTLRPPRSYAPRMHAP